MAGTADSPGDPADEESGEPGQRSLGGLFRSLMSMLATVVATAQTRLDLLVTELEEEVHRVAGLLIWALVALALFGVGLFMAGLTVIIAFWDSHRLLAAVLVTATFLLLGCAGLMKVWRIMHGKKRLLDATRTELERDAAQLRSQAGL